MKSVWSLAFALALALPGAAAAQKPKPGCPMHEGPAAPAAPPPTAEGPAHRHDHAASPYAGKQGTEVKALSEEELRAYREGTGMGLAKPAELNHYPGPRHVLDMGGELGLTPAQTADLRAIFDRMRAAAVALGEQIIANEKALDFEFASQAIDQAKLSELTTRIGALQAELRAAHLTAHLETKRVLTPEQVARYDSLRGYAPPPRS